MPILHAHRLHTSHSTCNPLYGRIHSAGWTLSPTVCCLTERRPTQVLLAILRRPARETRRTVKHLRGANAALTMRHPPLDFKLHAQKGHMYSEKTRSSRAIRVHTLADIVLYSISVREHYCLSRKAAHVARRYTFTTAHRVQVYGTTCDPSRPSAAACPRGCSLAVPGAGGEVHQA